MNVTKYYCDKCSSEVKEYNDLLKFSIRLESYQRPIECPTMALCSSCAMKVGVKFIPTPKKELTDTQTKDIRERLFDIMQEIVSMTN